MEDVLWKLESLSDFINDLNWPEEAFRNHLKVKVKEVIHSACLQTASRFFWCFVRATPLFLYCIVLYNTIQYKNEYYYSGINPVEFRGHSKTSSIKTIMKN